MSERDLVKRITGGMNLFDSFANDFLNLKFNDDGFPTFYKTTDLGFPFHDVYIIDDSGDLVLELAIAGYKKEDIKINVENDYLIVSSEISKETCDCEDEKCDCVPSKRKYVSKGISRKSFQKAWKIPGKYSGEPSAEFNNGILKIEFKLDEDKKPKQITIK